ncbi:uncharacterized protein [Periplaneta americana]|uniref:uncharacterized protein isoform X2 n=1 Tax=Periplaneta americana TaxID=6978 RepID=UPI0037E889D6
MQDLLPKKIAHCKTDDFIPALLKYFDICKESVRRMSGSRPTHQNMMMSVLADTLGGYLHSYVLPLVRRMYYAGTVRLENIKELVEYSEAVNKFLRTDGSGWRRPLRVAGECVAAEPLVVNPPGHFEKICSKLVTFTGIQGGAKKSRSKMSGKPSQQWTMYKRSVRKARSFPKQRKRRGLQMSIPLPYLDDAIKPAAVALPYKASHLLSLQSESSAFILVRYYVDSTKCLLAASCSAHELHEFNSNYYQWLKSEVIPHLRDDKWYPGFGGVLRVIEAMKKYGLGTHEDVEDGDSSERVSDDEQNEIPFPFGQPQFPSEGEEELLPENQNPKEEAMTAISKRKLILFVVGTAAGAFILILICICICKICRSKCTIRCVRKDNKKEVAEEKQQLLPPSGSLERPARPSILNMFVHIVYALRGNRQRDSCSINGSREEGGEEEGGQEEEEVVTSEPQPASERENRPQHPMYRRRNFRSDLPPIRHTSSTPESTESENSSTDSDGYPRQIQ